MSLPLITDPEILSDVLSQIHTEGSTPQQSRLRLVDLRAPENYQQGHIPGALHASASLLNRVEPPMGGLTPEPAAVAELLAQIGANMGDQIIAYDNGRETAAARLIWVLDAYGYEATSWLNGGFSAWQQLGLPISQDAVSVTPGDLTLSYIGNNVVSADELMTRLDAASLKILDVRSEAEYQGTDVRSARGGHVPGAVHFEWTKQLNSLGQIKDSDTLLKTLADKDVTPDDTVLVYCQTHQRSAVTYVVLKSLGFDNVVALDGAWSNWGNRNDTPIES